MRRSPGRCAIFKHWPAAACRRAADACTPLLPCCPSFFARRTDVCQGDVSVRVARRIMGGACARSGATRMRSYLPAFAKTAWVHRYCTALNGGTRCTVSPSRRHTGSGGAALLFWTLARRPSSGLGHTALSIRALSTSSRSVNAARLSQHFESSTERLRQT